MAYEIRFTDNVNKGALTVEDNSTNNETSLVLPGRTKGDYGQIVLENFLHLLENFANANPPRNPVEGQLWYDTTIGVDQLKVYDGAQWVAAGGLKKANRQPEASQSVVGDLWVDTENQQLWLYTGSGWILVGPEFSQGANTGPRFEEILDVTNSRRKIAVIYVDDKPVVIFSDVEFKPKRAIQGFERVYPGVNLSTSISGSPTVPKYYGTSEKAENLIIPGEGAVPATQFARRDRANSFTQPLRIQNSGGLRIGETPIVSLNVGVGNNAILRNLADGADIRLAVSEQGTIKNVLTVKGTSRVGINTDNPSEELDLVGNARIRGNLTVTGDIIIDENITIGNSVTIEEDLTVTGNIEQTGNAVLGNITPATNNTNIGSSISRFNTIFANTFNGNVTGSASSAGSASQLASPTIFRMVGDVETVTDVSFHGNDGTRIFDTILSSSLIVDKDSISSPLENDEFLINRGSTLFKIRQDRLVSKIPSTGVIGPIVPIGTILPWAGISDADSNDLIIPIPGWFLCNGATPPQGTYTNLYNVITSIYGPEPSSTTFRLPNFRGRTLFGRATNVESVYGGASSVTLSTNNLPQHTHSLMGDQGTQFYGATNVPGASDSDTGSITFTGTQTGSGITRTEGVTGFTSTDPFNIINPYGLVNYIIYHGVY